MGRVGAYSLGSDVNIASGAGVHRAFPGLARAANGHMVVIVRVGGTETDNGNLVKFTSTNDGVSWDSGTTILDESVDVRDPKLVKLSDDRLMCSYTRWNGTNDYTVFVMDSDDNGATWNTPISVNTSFTDWGFVSACVAELANGDLLLPIYGADTGGTSNNYSRLSKSTDGGATWSDFGELAKGNGRIWEEPNLCVHPSGLLLGFLRSDTSTAGIYLTKSSDSGVTWTTPSRLWDGSGQPACWYSQHRGLIVAYRQSGTNYSVFSNSWNAGTTWTEAVRWNSEALFAYAAFCDMPNDTVASVWCVEQNSTRGDITYTPMVAPAYSYAAVPHARNVIIGSTSVSVSEKIVL